MKKVIFIISFFIILISCEKIIPFTGEISQSKLVVNSLFDSENPWRIHVSYSLSVIDNGELGNVEDASVVIKDSIGNIVETLLYESEGYYRGNTYPQSNQDYRIEVTANGYNDVYSEDRLPSSINIISVDTMTNIVDGEEQFDMNIKFEDPGDFRNYYRISVHMGWWDIDWQTGDSILEEYQMPVLLEDPVFNNQNKWENEGLFTDLLFDGQEKDLEIAVELYEKLDDVEYLEVWLFNITEATYNFNKSYNIYQNASGNPFAQPVQVFSNVTNGFGIFGGAQLNVFPIK